MVEAKQKKPSTKSENKRARDEKDETKPVAKGDGKSKRRGQIETKKSTLELKADDGIEVSELTVLPFVCFADKYTKPSTS